VIEFGKIDGTNTIRTFADQRGNVRLIGSPENRDALLI
jgi:hypothetical protein